MKTLGYLVFIVLFLAECAVAALHPPTLEWWMLIALGLAALRVGRSISYNGVFAWLRAPFTVTTPDSSGAGDSTNPRQDIHPLLYALGDCIACPICTSTHGAGILYALLAWLPPLGMVLILVLAAAQIAEVFHWHSERDEWQGRHAREEAGTIWLYKDDKQRTQAYKRETWGSR